VTKRLFNKLIETYIDEALSDPRIFLLKEAEDDAAPADDLGDLDDLGGDDAEGDDLDLDGGDLGGDAGGELDLGGEGEDLEGEDGEDLGDDDMGGDFGGGGGGGFGGGFGGGGGDDDGGFGDEEGEGEGEDEMPEPEEVELAADPVQAAVDIAINMLDETGNDQEILNAVKASIQGNFESYEDSVPIITSLWETEHPILKVVARKLLLFIKGQ
jgi:hypothetical protein